MTPRAALLAALATGAVVAGALLLIPGAFEREPDPGEAVIAPAADPSAGARAETGTPVPFASAPEEEAQPAPRDAAAATGTEPPAPATPRAHEGRPRVYPVIWVRDAATVRIRTEPGGSVVAVADSRTEFGSVTAFGVHKIVDGWAAVSTHELPNGELGWVRLDRERLGRGSTRKAVVIDLSERHAELRQAGKPVLDFEVTIGAPDSETPTGRFAVTDTIRGGLNPVYGCCAIAISAIQSDLPPWWTGGDRIAIHATSGPIGAAASLGCVRATDANVSALLDRVPLGTPVFIRA